MDGLSEFLADQMIAAAQLVIARQRRFNPLGITPIERSSGMPRQ
jgi:hypothetical protein